MVQKRLAHHNVVAVFDTFEGGREALDELRDVGLSTDELSLLGPEHVMRPGQSRITDTPGTTTTGVARTAVAGIGAGTAGGGALGALAGAAVTAIPGVGLAVGAGALYAGVAGAAVGQIAGGLLGAETGARKSMMWTQSLQPFVARVREDDQVLVGVHTEDPSRADTAEDVFDGLETTEVVRLDADESFVPPGDVSAAAGRSVPSSVPDHPGGELGRDRADEDAPTLGMATRGSEDDEEPAEPEER